MNRRASSPSPPSFGGSAGFSGAGRHVFRKIFASVVLAAATAAAAGSSSTAPAARASPSSVAADPRRLRRAPAAFVVGGGRDEDQRRRRRTTRLSSSRPLSDGRGRGDTGAGGGGADRRRLRRRHGGDDDDDRHRAARAAKNDVLFRSCRLSLAPMMDYTDRHFRALVRLISGRTLLYSEMIAADAILETHGRRGKGRASLESGDSLHLRRLLGQGVVAPEGPSVLQLGGSDPSQMFDAARTVSEFSRASSRVRGGGSSGTSARCEYTALNLNCGCPSPAVSGRERFGAALMDDPPLVARLVRAMRDGCDGSLPVTVKCRVGAHDAGVVPFSRSAYEGQSRSEREKEYRALANFVEVVASDGVATHFQVHARVAVLGGTFSPADNRDVPPLRRDHVRRLAREYPELTFVLNGGIDSLAQARGEMDDRCDGGELLGGVMVGRAFAADPWGFATADEALYGDDGGSSESSSSPSRKPRNRREVLEAYGRHADLEERLGDPAEVRRSLVGACAHLFAGEANSRKFRIDLDEIAGRPERLERGSKARAWSAAPIATTDGGGGWDEMQARDDARPAWDEGQPPLSELMLDAARRHLGEEVLERTPQDSYDKKIWEAEEAKMKRAAGNPVISVGGGDGEKVSGGVVDGWLNNGAE